MGEGGWRFRAGWAASPSVAPKKCGRLLLHPAATVAATYIGGPTHVPHPPPLHVAPLPAWPFTLADAPRVQQLAGDPRIAATTAGESDGEFVGLRGGGLVRFYPFFRGTVWAPLGNGGSGGGDARIAGELLHARGVGEVNGRRQSARGV